MEDFFADRIRKVPKSFIREILKVSLDPTFISFAGGLPNPAFFPMEDIRAATNRVFDATGPALLQYANSEGDLRLREIIAQRYLAKKGIKVAVENILITNGSQQGIDLLAKVLLNDGDGVVIEKPGYLGAIQSLSLYRPNFLAVELGDDGIDLAGLEKATKGGSAKMMYAVPVFQNPSGISYTEANKAAVAAIARKNSFLLVEDDPYGELRFSGSPVPSFYAMAPERTVLLGTFSKIVAPALRLGWLVSPPELTERLLVAKQAADLHTTSFSQKILAEYLSAADLDTHIARITEVYGRQCRAMQQALADLLPREISFTRPEGGMFLWGRLPEHLDSTAFFEEAVKEKVVFVPGTPFYTTKGPFSSFRLNYSCVDPETVKEGVGRLARAWQRFQG